MRREISFPSHGVNLSAWHYEAENDDLVTPRGKPCVVMAHGLAGTKDSGLEPYAERFAAAGADVLVFDYRGFGMSDGQPRQVVDHRRHREDYQTAVGHARTLAGVDSDRIVLWGTSFSGGHVIAVAADDPRIAGVIAQNAAMDGLAAVLNIWSYAGPRHLLKLTGHGLLDAGRALLRRSPHYVPVIGPPDTIGAMTSDDAMDGYLAITGPSFVNEMAARAALMVSLNRPVTVAKKLRMPLLLVVAEHDSVAPPSTVEKVAKRARGPVQVERLAIGHFDVYVGDAFEESVKTQAEFLRSL